MTLPELTPNQGKSGRTWRHRLELALTANSFDFCFLIIGGFGYSNGRLISDFWPELWIKLAATVLLVPFVVAISNVLPGSLSLKSLRASWPQGWKEYLFWVVIKQIPLALVASCTFYIVMHALGEIKAPLGPLVGQTVSCAVVGGALFASARWFWLYLGEDVPLTKSSLK